VDDCSGGQQVLARERSYDAIRLRRHDAADERSLSDFLGSVENHRLMKPFSITDVLTVLREVPRT